MIAYGFGSTNAGAAKGIEVDADARKADAS
jgi:hypothetical protein